MASEFRAARDTDKRSLVGTAVRVYLAILAITAAVLLALKLHLILILVFLEARSSAPTFGASSSS